MSEGFPLAQAFIASLSLHVAVLGGIYGVVELRGQPTAGDGRGVGSVIFVDALGSGGTYSGAASVSLGAAPEIQAIAGTVVDPLKDQGAKLEVVAPERNFAKASSQVKRVELVVKHTKRAPRASGRPEVSESDRQSSGMGGPASSDSPGSAGMLGGGGGTGALKPVALETPKPPYPYEARRDGFQGSVLLEISIDTAGKVEEARVVKSSSRSDCDRVARDTILDSWRFEPATLNGQAIEWRQKVLVSYQLR